MPKKFPTKAPFGVQAQRFNKIGLHPRLVTDGTIPPNQYNPEYFECAYKKYLIGGSSWKRKATLEEFSANLGFRNPEVLERRRYLRLLGGPGSYDIPQEIYKKKSFSALKDVNFGKSKRFIGFEDDDVPAPGTYTEDLIASSSTNKKQMTPVDIFQWDGFVDRFKRPEQPWIKAPNRYSPIDRGSMEALLLKVVSKRGPYNLFTGPRDGTTIKNHFSPPQNCTPDKYYTWASHIDHLLHHPSKNKTGSFLHAPRFTKKPLEDSPSPATYQIKANSFKKIPQSLHPFDDSVKVTRRGVKWKIEPGPGRYYEKYPKCNGPKRESWVFKSNTKRTIYKFSNYTIFD